MKNSRNAEERNNDFSRKKTVEKLRNKYPKGARVELTKMNDIQAPPIGTKGTVRDVDDSGNILVSWDTGSSLSVVYGADTCKIIERKTIHETK